MMEEEEEQEWIESPDGWGKGVAATKEEDGGTCGSTSGKKKQPSDVNTLDEEDDGGTNGDGKKQQQLADTTTASLVDDNDDDPPAFDLFNDSDPQEVFEFIIPALPLRKTSKATIRNDGDESDADNTDPDTTTSSTHHQTITTMQHPPPEPKKKIVLSGYKLDSDETAHSTGVTLWQAAPKLATYLCCCCQQEFIIGRTVLELGAGLGLCGIVAFNLGAKHVVCTDADTNVLQAMRRNVHANCTGSGGSGTTTTNSACNNNNDKNDNDKRIDCVQLNWSAPSPFRNKYGTFDTILAADVIYVKESVGPLLDTVALLLQANNGRFLLSWITRYNSVPVDFVLDAARSRNLVCTQQPENGIYVMQKIDDKNIHDSR